MADDDLLVTISGPAFSLLLYENARSDDQIGFFLGEILIYVTKKVTDSDRDVEHIKRHINVKNVVAYPISEPFFNTPGQIDEDKLNNFLQDSVKNVVGWYHYRRDLPLKATFRDRNLHSDLSAFFSSINKLQEKENFIFCLLNSTKSDTGGTHKFKQLLLRKESMTYKPVSLKINNLGADATRPDGSDYKPTPTASSCESDVFDKIYKCVRNDLEKSSGVMAVTLIQKASEQFLEKLIGNVSKTDQQVSLLEQELKQLRNEHFHDLFEKVHLEHQMRQMEVDSKSDVMSEPRSPQFSELFESSKSQSIPGSSVKVATKKHIKQESGGGERTRDSSSSDREIMQITQGKECLAASKSDDYGATRLLEMKPKESGSSGGSGSGTVDRISRAGRSGKQITDAFIQNSAAKTGNYSGTRGMRRTQDHEQNDS